ncbi:MAG: hypothetical protein WKF34_08305 [Pyrinomonadaceae bacterium]
MEILIFGVILVALMVYASTKLKKFTAAAFEAETIETDEFIVNKPDGFLHVINGNPNLVFESYSKDFGGPGAEEIRKATATLRVDVGRTIEHVLADRLPKDEASISDETEIVGEIRYRMIVAYLTSDGVGRRVHHKIAERDGKIYDFEVNTLSETTDDITRDIEAMITSFAVK